MLPKTRALSLGCVLAVAVLLCACASGRGGPVSPAAVRPAADGGAVSAVLFPYIPDAAVDSFASLIADLENGFFENNPNLQATITIDPNMDLYDLSPGGTLATLLGDGPDAVDVVELDTILLGDLVANGWVQVLDTSGITLPEIVGTAWSSASLVGDVYGVPTYLCSNVVYSQGGGITAVGNSTELIGFLTGLGPATPLVGNYAGSWTLPSTYVDAWADTNGNDPQQVVESYSLPLDQATMSFFQPVVDLCAQDQTNPCLDGTFKDNTAAEEAYAAGNANGFVGYTERLFFILTANPGLALPSLVSAPLGNGIQPVMFVDALVVNPNCQGACLANALTFISYMSTTGVRNLIAFSEDAPAGTVPRYLLQASLDFYGAAPAATNPIYQALLPAIVNQAQSYPNQGFPEARVALNPALQEALGGGTGSVAVQFGPLDRGAGQRLPRRDRRTGGQGFGAR